MDTGVLVLAGVFAAAVLLMVLNGRHRRGVERELLRGGFVACEEEARALEDVFTTLAGGHGDAPRRRYVVARCFRRPTGRSTVYRFRVLDQTHADDHPDRNTVGASFDAFLLDLPNGGEITRGPVSLMLLPTGPSVLRGVMAQIAAASPLGAPLILPNGSRPIAILAAWGETSRPLDEVVPQATQDRLARGADTGVLFAHFHGARAAFTVNPHRRLLERQWSWIAEWT